MNHYPDHEHECAVQEHDTDQHCICRCGALWTFGPRAHWEMPDRDDPRYGAIWGEVQDDRP